MPQGPRRRELAAADGEARRCPKDPGTGSGWRRTAMRCDAPRTPAQGVGGGGRRGEAMPQGPQRRELAAADGEAMRCPEDPGTGSGWRRTARRCDAPRTPAQGVVGGGRRGDAMPQGPRRREWAAADGEARRCPKDPGAGSWRRGRRDDDMAPGVTAPVFRRETLRLCMEIGLARFGGWLT